MRLELNANSALSVVAVFAITESKAKGDLGVTEIGGKLEVAGLTMSTDSTATAVCRSY